MTTPARTALSAFLKEKRDQVTPQMVGLPVNGVRRVPGLRREEVAMLAGVSVDWYVRLEQGRPVHPSEEVLAAIANVLRLNVTERTYLMNLARPGPHPGRYGAYGADGADGGRPTVRPGIIRLLDGLENQPGFVLGPRQEVLAGNELAWALLADFPARPANDRNLLRWVLSAPEARALYLDWEDIVSDMVGVLQAEASAAPNDPRIRALVGELTAASPAFRERWARPAPEGRTSGRKRFRHPVVGDFIIDWEAFTLQEDSTQTVFIYMGHTDDDVDKLRLLAAWRSTVLERRGQVRSKESEKAGQSPPARKTDRPRT